MIAPIVAASVVTLGATRSRAAAAPVVPAKNPTPASPASPASPSLDLPRFKSTGRADASRLAVAKVSVDDLLPQGQAGAKTATKQNLNYLAVESGKEWSRPLRGSPRDTTFVSFLVNASEGTVIEVGGARLAVKVSAKAGYA